MPLRNSLQRPQSGRSQTWESRRTNRNDSRRHSRRSALSGVTLARRIASIPYAQRNKTHQRGSKGRSEATHLVQQDIVRAAERPAPLLQSIADGVDLRGSNVSCKNLSDNGTATHAELPTDLLVDDRANEAASRIASDLSREEILVRELEEGLLGRGLARSDDVADLVVDEEEDKGEGFDGLGEEEAQAVERGLFGLVGDGSLSGSTAAGEKGEELLLPAMRDASAEERERRQGQRTARQRLGGH